MVVDSGKPRLIIAVWEWANFFGEEAKERGIRANIASFTRLHPNIMMTKAKVSGNYVSSILAKTESQRAGFDEAIMLDPAGLRGRVHRRKYFCGAQQRHLHAGTRRRSSKASRATACDHAGARPGSHASWRSPFRATSSISPMRCSSAARPPKSSDCAKSTSAPSAAERRARSLAPCKRVRASSPADAMRPIRRCGFSVPCGTAFDRGDSGRSLRSSGLVVEGGAYEKTQAPSGNRSRSRRHRP